jgi:hypothetical protein
MKQLHDLRRQVAATASHPFGLTTGYERVWVKEVAGLGGEAAFAAEKVDTRYNYPIQNLDPGSPTFGWMLTTDYDNPFNRGPI